MSADRKSGDAAPSTDRWMRSFRWRRWQIRANVLRHRSHLPDRWVFQTSTVYDRKDR